MFLIAVEKKNNTKPQTHSPVAPELLGDPKAAVLEHAELQLFVCRTGRAQTAPGMA